MSSASMSRISGRQAMPARGPASSGSKRAQRTSRPRTLSVKASFNQGTAKKVEGAEVARTIVAAKTPFLKSGQIDLGAYEQLLGRMVCVEPLALPIRMHIMQSSIIESHQSQFCRSLG